MRRNRIKELRFENDPNQTQLAKEAKICRQTISLIERSKCILSLFIATRISKMFNEPVTNIFIFDEEEIF